MRKSKKNDQNVRLNLYLEKGLNEKLKQTAQAEYLPVTVYVKQLIAKAVLKNNSMYNPLNNEN
ncbi:hypothetical protein [Carboxylicivirga sp. N1Y90]|uniref:hypothetical protein n=1 Tax=Carboxylicivirga fragile TaxID=3417571 RepID=UPI003D34E56E|nr:hypothetical protein [Marinilabiliaceae bacterium N1Y90]